MLLLQYATYRLCGPSLDMLHHLLSDLTSPRRHPWLSSNRVPPSHHHHRRQRFDVLHQQNIPPPQPPRSMPRLTLRLDAPLKLSSMLRSGLTLLMCLCSCLIAFLPTVRVPYSFYTPCLLHFARPRHILRCSASHLTYLHSYVPHSRARARTSLTTTHLHIASDSLTYISASARLPRYLSSLFSGS